MENSPPEAIWDSSLCIYVPRPKWTGYQFFVFHRKQASAGKSPSKNASASKKTDYVPANKAWKTLPEEEKQKFLKLADEDKERKEAADAEYEDLNFFTLKDGTRSCDLPEPKQEMKSPHKSQAPAEKRGFTSAVKKRRSPKTETKVILHYFNLIGRAETTRMILHYFEVPFEDHRIEMDEWSEFKTSYNPDFGQLPALEIDGLRLVQSVSINQYLCEKYGAVPRTLEDQYAVSSLVQFKEDLQEQLFKLGWNKDVKGLEAWYKESAPVYLEMLEKRLCSNLDGEFFFIHRRESLADFTWFELGYDWFLRPTYAKYEPILAEHAPKFRRLLNRMMTKSDSLNSYLHTRLDLWF